uniref:Ig-like domain-containing protein n=1 Tax=Canis lupus familiaris TaxID=9615 RepID=A0A8I3PDS1_CANLF
RVTVCTHLEEFPLWKVCSGILPTDKSANEDTSPKPTVFLPSISEIKIHKAGTYLCLLEDFFPEIIKVDWKEKNDQTVLQSQQGNTMKTKDTYMKFSWLTVTGASMDKEHKCIVNHESDRGGINQEILFPSINEGMYIQIGI